MIPIDSGEDWEIKYQLTSDELKTKQEADQLKNDLTNARIAVEGIQQWLRELNRSQSSSSTLAKFLAEEITRRTGVCL